MVSLFPSAVASTLQSCCLNRLDCTRSPHASLRFRGPRVTQSVAAPVALEYQGIRRSCHSSPPRLQSLTRLLDTYMASSRWVFRLPNVPHVSPQANVAARRCLGDRLINFDAPLDTHVPNPACSGYGFWKLIPISYPIYSNVIV